MTAGPVPRAAFARSGGALLLLAALGACAGPAPVASIRTEAGTVELLPPDADGAPVLRAGSGAVALAGFRRPAIRGYWSVGGTPVLAVSGDRGGCAESWSLAAVTRDAIILHPFAACGPMTFTLRGTLRDDDALVAASADATWLFRDGELTGPRPVAEPAAQHPTRLAARRRERPPPPAPPVLAENVPPVAPAPPPVSQPVGPDVIPPPVGTAPPPAPSLPLR